ncbi:MAG TPA: hypothetical protein VKT80_16710, partial [Chloroflexota bacterium]|nr:hypothetical protein [Chloroflexota bacterium]
MTILWCGGEDIDFPNGTTPTLVDTGATHSRTGYARFAIDNRATFARSLSFSGGVVTSAWASCRAWAIGAQTGNNWIGLGLNASGNKGICIGTDTTSSTKLAIAKFDGTTRTQLATESGTSLTTATLHKLDLQVTGNAGMTSCTITAYVDTVQVATVSGQNLSALFADLDCYLLGNNGGGNFVVSEFIVSDSDTRTMSLLTMAPNAAGDTNNWTNAFSNINPNLINDSNVIFVNTTGQDFQANLTDMPSGSFAILAVKAAARAEVTAGSTPTKIKMG